MAKCGVGSDASIEDSLWLSEAEVFFSRHQLNVVASRAQRFAWVVYNKHLSGARAKSVEVVRLFGPSRHC